MDNTGYQPLDTPATQKDNPYYAGPSVAGRKEQIKAREARYLAREARRRLQSGGTEGKGIVLATRGRGRRRSAVVVPVTPRPAPRTTSLSPDPPLSPTPIKTSKPSDPQVVARDARQARRQAQRGEVDNVDSWDGPRPKYSLGGPRRVPKSVTSEPRVGPVRNAASALDQLKSIIGDGFSQIRGVASAPSGRLEQLKQANRAVAVAIQNAIAVYTKTSNTGQTNVKRRSGARMRIVNPDRDYFCNT